MKILFAQGNPEPRYATTRHNAGWIVLDALATQLGVPWKTDAKHNALIAQGVIAGQKTLLVKPLSYYNETGRVAQSLIHFYKLSPSTDLLVLHDDLALPFGTLRVREKGSDAGNNGIKSLNTHLGDAYTRIRIGIWTDQASRIGDVNFVLAHFSQAEQTHLTETITPAVLTLMNDFVQQKLTPHSVTHAITP